MIDKKNKNNNKFNSMRLDLFERAIALRPNFHYNMDDHDLFWLKAMVNAIYDMYELICDDPLEIDERMICVYFERREEDGLCGNDDGAERS